ncbi:MAG: hypothetical protein NTV98_02135 [Candidatus Roizmanbacteria bacterium]|nr:hypothetical protein [Candidatus Roizmanbacteria bacterium]
MTVSIPADERSNQPISTFADAARLVSVQALLDSGSKNITTPELAQEVIARRVARMQQVERFIREQDTPEFFDSNGLKQGRLQVATGEGGRSRQAFVDSLAHELGYVPPIGNEMRQGMYERLPSLTGGGEDAITIHDPLPKSPKILDPHGSTWVLARSETIFTKPSGKDSTIPPNQVSIRAIKMK